MIRYLKFVCGSLVGLTFFVAAILYWFVATESGLNWVLSKAQPQVTASTVRGTLTNLLFSKLTIALENIHITVESGRLNWQLSGLLSREIRVKNIELDDVDIATKPSQQTQQNGPRNIDLPFSLIVEQGALNGLSLNLESDTRIMLDTVRLDGTLYGNILDLNKLQVEQSGNSAFVSGQVDLSTSPTGILNVEHSVNWEYKNYAIESIGAISGNWSSADFTLEGIAPINFVLNGRVQEVLSETINWESSLEITGIDEIALANQTISIEKAQIESNGEYKPQLGLQSLVMNLDGTVIGGHEEFPNWQLQADARLGDSVVSIDVLEFQNLDADKPTKLHAFGEIIARSFFEEPETALKNTVIDLNGNWQSLTWPLNGESPLFSSDGNFSVSGLLDNIQLVSKVNAETQGRNIAANIDLGIQPSAIEVNYFEANAGASTLRVKGNVNENYLLNLEADFPDLSEISADYSGQFSGSGTISGKRSDPKVELLAKSSGLSFGSYSIGGVEAVAIASLMNSREALSVSIETKNLELEQRLIAESLNFKIDGSTQSHSVTLDSILSEGSTAKVRATGQWLGEQWGAVVSEFSIDNPIYDTWVLDRDILIEASNLGVSATNSCLINKGQSVCAAFNQSSDIFNLQGDFNSISLANLTPLLKLYSLTADGVVDGNFAYSKRIDDSEATATAALSAQNTQITWLNSIDGEQANETLVFESISLAASQDSKFYADAEVTLLDKGIIKGQIQVASPFNSEQFKTAELVGSGSINIEDLSVLPAAMLNNTGLNGSLNSDFSIEGKVSAPRLFANAALRNATADIPNLGLQLEDIELNLTASGGTVIQALGSLTSGSGRLNIAGDIDFADLMRPTAQISLNGNNIQLVNTHEINVAGTVDVMSKLEVDKIDLSGLVSMTQAKLNFARPESLVLASDDVTLEGEEIQKNILKRSLNVELDFGDNTHIEAQGLQSDLTGRLRVFQEPNGILRGQGQLVLSNGVYRSYGQNLSIDNGYLLFTGGSIDEPTLDIQAQDTIDETIVGVRIQGKASAPEVNLYSSPSMEDEDVLSMLLFRKPLSELSSQDGFVLLSIADSLRGGGTNKITQLTDKVQQIFGLSTLEVNLTDTAPNIFAGKQISSKLRVGYGYSLLDAVQSLILQYKLSQSWFIKANAGVTSGADLRYQIER